MSDEAPAPVYRPFRVIEGEADAPFAEPEGYGGPEPVFERGGGFRAGTRGDVPTPALPMRCAASLADRPIPDRPWLVRDLIPDRAVTILAGDGGVGKSLLALQLAVATSRATDWAGAMPEPGPVLYLSAEDDLDELHRRLDDIVGQDLRSLVDLHLLPLAGLDAVLGAADGRGLIAGTPLLRAIAAKVAELRPRLLVVDNLADAFAGNENSRPEARQFVGLLRGLAIAHDLAVVLISHPSPTGLSSGTVTSGSTAWSNSVRSRLYLDRAKSEDGDEPDPALRVLKLLKSNYAPTGTEIRLRWEAGSFKLDGISSASSFDRMAAEQQAERIFLTLLERSAREGRDVSHKPSVTYAPAVFAKHPANEGFGKAAFEKAMNRLFSDDAIRVEAHGPPSRRYSKIVASKGEVP